MNTVLDDEMVLLSQCYQQHGIYSPLVPQQGPITETTTNSSTKPVRRRRKRNKAGGELGVMMRKRKLSEEQVNMLEQSFGDEHKLESERKDRLASELGLDPRQVAVWFQNRRARFKCKKLEEEYARLKSEHETTVVEKCRLETELLKLKEQLNEAEKEIQRLSSDGFSSNSPSSSFSMEAIHDQPRFLGDQFGMNELNMNVFYNVQDQNNDYANYGLEWDNLYYV